MTHASASDEEAASTNDPGTDSPVDVTGHEAQPGDAKRAALVYNPIKVLAVLRLQHHEIEKDEWAGRRVPPSRGLKPAHPKTPQKGSGKGTAESCLHRTRKFD